jgi:pyruvate-formate lyase-activating enzyme
MKPKGGAVQSAPGGSPSRPPRSEPAGPRLLYADASGNILDCPQLEAAGAAAGRWRRLSREEWMPLPAGSELFLLPARLPVGYDPRGRRFRVLDRDPAGGGPLSAVAAFVAPAHTQLASPAYVRDAGAEGAALLPLFAYTAAGWDGRGFVAAAVRVDPDPRQDIDRFDPQEVARRTAARLRAEPGNRLLQHLGRCSLSYGCPAARNLFLGRWEAPLPTSPACNARCLGCISLQEGSGVCATQERLDFVPTAAEVCGVAVPHLRAAQRAVASFGQGCEGEPLLQWKLLEDCLRRIRGATSRGTLNLNTNASLPEALRRLHDAGLDSVRVSLNSCRPGCYERYYRPKGYGLAEVRRAAVGFKSAGGFLSLNYFVLPGFTDEQEELEALCAFLEECRADLIQLRNLNIDPEWYLASLRHEPRGEPLGILRWLQTLRERFPALRFGYYNPCLDPAA